MKLAWPVNSPPNGRLQQVPVELTITSSSFHVCIAARLGWLGQASAESLDGNNRENIDSSGQSVLLKGNPGIFKPGSYV